MKQEKATVLGFLAASFLPAVIFALLRPLTGTLDFASMLSTLRVIYPFAAIATILLGAPTFIVLRRFGGIRWWTTLVVGGLLGVILAVLVRLPSAVDVRDMVVLVPMTSLSAFAFWLVWRLGDES